MEPFHFEKTTSRADCIAWLQKVDGLYSAKVSGEYKGHKESNGVTYSKLADSSLRGKTKVECVKLTARIPCTPARCKHIFLEYTERMKWDKTSLADGSQQHSPFTEE
eukprot:gene25123-34745_t